MIVWLGAIRLFLMIDVKFQPIPTTGIWFPSSPLIQSTSTQHHLPDSFTVLCQNITLPPPTPSLPTQYFLAVHINYMYVLKLLSLCYHSQLVRSKTVTGNSSTVRFGSLFLLCSVLK